MSVSLLLRGARQLITLHGFEEPRRGSALNDLGIIRDGAMLIEDGRITEVGPSRRIENLDRARRSFEIDATGRVVMPGFVDAHAQLVWATLPQDDGDTYADAQFHLLRSVSARRLESRARHFVNGMIRHGTTSLESNCGYGLDQRTELKLLRVQARLHRAPADVTSTYLNPPWVPDAREGAPAAYVAWLCSEMLPAIQRKSLARFVGVRCGEPVFDAEQRRRYVEAARSLGFQLKIDANGCSGSEAVRLAVELGARSVHRVAGAAAEAELLAASDTLAVLLPASTFRCGAAGGSLGRRLIDAGAAVALGSDFLPGSNSTYSMQTVVALACAHLGMSAAEAICAATYNAACAIGAAGVAGSLEVGKPADFVVLNAADYREIPCHFGVNLVQRTVKRGATIYQEGSVALR
ncbi:MAG TPA: amidohydrolase family protein [Bryobacteraceae bacterium]|nr:amidohydrolase family protein [Bryobacteraceae bacterium]